MYIYVLFLTIERIWSHTVLWYQEILSQNFRSKVLLFFNRTGLTNFGSQKDQQKKAAGCCRLDGTGDGLAPQWSSFDRSNFSVSDLEKVLSYWKLIGFKHLNSKFWQIFVAKQSTNQLTNWRLNYVSTAVAALLAPSLKGRPSSRSPSPKWGRASGTFLFMEPMQTATGFEGSEFCHLQKLGSIFCFNGIMTQVGCCCFSFFFQGTFSHLILWTFLPHASRTRWTPERSFAVRCGEDLRGTWAEERLVTGCRFFFSPRASLKKKQNKKNTWPAASELELVLAMLKPTVFSADGRRSHSLHVKRAKANLLQPLISMEPGPYRVPFYRGPRNILIIMGYPGKWEVHQVWFTRIMIWGWQSHVFLAAILLSILCQLALPTALINGNWNHGWAHRVGVVTAALKISEMERQHFMGFPSNNLRYPCKWCFRIKNQRYFSTFRGLRRHELFSRFQWELDPLPQVRSMKDMQLPFSNTESPLVVPPRSLTRDLRCTQREKFERERERGVELQGASQPI